MFIWEKKAKREEREGRKEKEERKVQEQDFVNIFPVSSFPNAKL